MEYRNLAEVLRKQAENLGPRTALRFKRHGLYHDLSWEQYRAEVVAAAAALLDAGIQAGDRVGLLSENRLEWLIADMAIMTVGAINVPPHSPLTARQVHFQLEETETRWLFVSNQEQLEKIRQVRRELPRLENVIVFDTAAAGSDAQSWSGFLQRGRMVLDRWNAELVRREEKLGPDDLATIMYTSGTTGNPKGVMLTHGNLLSNAIAVREAFAVPPHALMLSWLPYSHIYARTVDHYESLVAGVPLCLAESAETLIENLAEVQPTQMTSVPRFYEKVLSAVASPDAEKTARTLRRIFGPRIEVLSSGGAPLPRPVAEAYHAAGLLLLQGYGLTESSPVISFNRKSHYKIATVGLPIPGVEVKIADDGEVLTRGPLVMRGYWKNDAATAEAIRDGWLYTGDLGEIDADGFLSITGRKKELLVLSNGKKVVPSYIEGLLIADECIDQAAICGEGRSFLTALIVPHWDNLRRALRSEGTSLDDQTPSALAKHSAVISFLHRRIDAALKDVANWERVRKFVVLAQPFSVANDELTVSLKLRRNVVLSHHAAELEALYRDSDEDRGSS
ncbi:MAG TPA: long-chain fatty acid--CoA ligase [Gemmataceae bacterium]|jgi:long-chain acyl-CoA synthetase|nr:long-chain fatty acid--CoA ligase [Gemmataceae bacterium]